MQIRMSDETFYKKLGSSKHQATVVFLPKILDIGFREGSAKMMQVFESQEEVLKARNAPNTPGALGSKMPPAAARRSPGKGLRQAAMSPNSSMNDTFMTSKSKKKKGLMRSAVPLKLSQSPPPAPAPTAPTSEGPQQPGAGGVVHEDKTAVVELVAPPTDTTTSSAPPPPPQLAGPSPPPTASLTLSAPIPPLPLPLTSLEVQPRGVELMPVMDSPGLTQLDLPVLPRLSLGGMIAGLRAEVAGQQPTPAGNSSDGSGDGSVSDVAAAAELERVRGRAAELEAELSSLTEAREQESAAHREAVAQLQAQLSSKAQQDVDGLKINTERSVNRQDQMIRQQAESWKAKLEEATAKNAELELTLEHARGEGSRGAERARGAEEALRDAEARSAERGQQVVELERRTVELGEELERAVAKAVSQQVIHKSLQASLALEATQLRAQVAQLQSTQAEMQRAQDQRQQELVASSEAKQLELQARLDEALAAAATAAAAATSATPAAPVTETEAATAAPSLAAEELGLLKEFETVENVLAEGAQMQSRCEDLSAQLTQRGAELDQLQSSTHELSGQLQSACTQSEAVSEETVAPLN
jgi:hypothetical protein